MKAPYLLGNHARYLGLAMAAVLLALCSGGCSIAAGFGERIDFDGCVFDDCDEDGCGPSQRMNGTLRRVSFSLTANGDNVVIQHSFVHRRNFPDMYLCTRPNECYPIGGPLQGSPQTFQIFAASGSSFDLEPASGELALSGDRRGNSICSYVRWGADEAPSDFLANQDTESQIHMDWDTDQIDVPGGDGIPEVGQISRDSLANGLMDRPSEWQFELR